MSIWTFRSSAALLRDDGAVASVSVIGPGAVGGTLAAHLSKSTSHALQVAVRTPFETLEVEVSGELIRTSPVLITDPESAQPTDWVLVATKTYDAASSASWLERMTRPDSVVAILQNGVEHVERFAPFVAERQLLPIVVNLPSLRKAPGRIVQQGAPELTVPEGEAGQRFAALFAGTSVRIRLTDDFLTAAWTKLALNATGALTAATLVPRLDLRDQVVEALVRRVVGEAVEVGQAEGARLRPDLVDDVVLKLAQSTSNAPNSLHADRLAGRRMEIDARNGAVVRLGAKHGIETPLNAVLVDLLSLAQWTSPSENRR